MHSLNIQVYKLVEDIRAKGGVVTREPGPVKGGQSVIAFVKDPDGYVFELIQRVPTPQPLLAIQKLLAPPILSESLPMDVYILLELLLLLLCSCNQSLHFNRSFFILGSNPFLVYLLSHVSVCDCNATSKLFYQFNLKHQKLKIIS